MIATLSTCAQLERDNISFRLQSGRKRFIEKGGKLGRKVGSVKTAEQMKAEYREVIATKTTNEIHQKLQIDYNKNLK